MRGLVEHLPRGKRWTPREHPKAAELGLISAGVSPCFLESLVEPDCHIYLGRLDIQRAGCKRGKCERGSRSLCHFPTVAGKAAGEGWRINTAPVAKRPFLPSSPVAIQPAAAWEVGAWQEVGGEKTSRRPRAAALFPRLCKAMVSFAFSGFN